MVDRGGGGCLPFASHRDNVSGWSGGRVSGGVTDSRLRFVLDVGGDGSRLVGLASLAPNRTRDGRLDVAVFVHRDWWVIGARLFFVVQKWSELPGETLTAKLIEALKFTEGGLVVFGSFIGGAVAVIWWSLRRKYRLLVMGDMIAPGLMLGLCLGRLGCLMNGCCYGGVCEAPVPGLSFPRGSLPYMDQLSSGKLIGLTLSESSGLPGGGRIEAIAPGSWAEQNHLNVGDRVDSIRTAIEPPERGSDPAGPPRVFGEVTVAGRMYRLNQTLPGRSLPIHPTQLYASINAGLICGFLFFLWPNVGRDGIVLGLWLVLCGSSRMLEEWIRIDEPDNLELRSQSRSGLASLGCLSGLFYWDLCGIAPRVDTSWLPRHLRGREISYDRIVARLPEARFGQSLRMPTIQEPERPGVRCLVSERRAAFLQFRPFKPIAS